MNKLIKTIVLIVIVSSLTSCYTINELTMSDSKRATQCNWVNNNR